MEKLTNFNKKATIGFRLRYVEESDSWQFHAAEHGAWEGSLREIWQKMNWDFQIKNSEVRLALSEMDKNNHTVSDFGIWGSFICTFEK